jgi:DNA-binding transcriptional regulator YhcF (GntR family)
MPEDHLEDHGALRAMRTEAAQPAVSESAALAQLRAFIADRAYQPGDRLPPERVLCTELGLRRSELRKALETLEREDVLWRHVGKGTFLTANTGQTHQNDFGRLSQQVSPADVMRARGARQQQIGHRREVERGQRRQPQPADDDPAQRLARLGPRAEGQISGTPPSTVATIVIITGRSRMRRRLFDRLAHRRAAVAQLVGEFDDQDAVLGHDPHQQHQPDLAVDVQAAPGQHQRKDRAGQAQRHGGHHDDRRDEAFELRRQHQEHDEEREAEGQSSPAEVSPSVAASASGTMRCPRAGCRRPERCTSASASPSASSGVSPAVIGHRPRICASRRVRGRRRVPQRHEGRAAPSPVARCTKIRSRSPGSFTGSRSRPAGCRKLRRRRGTRVPTVRPSSTACKRLAQAVDVDARDRRRGRGPPRRKAAAAWCHSPAAPARRRGFPPSGSTSLRGHSRPAVIVVADEREGQALPAPRMPSELGWIAKARTPITPRSAPLISATISCWLRSRSAQGPASSP